MVAENFFFIDEIYDYNPRWIQLLPGKGCAWAKKSGGCYMCGFKKKTDEFVGQFTDDDIIELFREAEVMTQSQQPQKIAIYNGGSFLNDEEISHKVQSEICIKISLHPTIETLMVESRPEFVTEQKIAYLISLLGKKRLQVGIGLECENDKVRTRCIHKGFLKVDYERAAKVLKDNGAELFTYIFIKPLYLSEKGAIEEAIKSVKYAFEVGSKEVSLSCAFIQEGTRMEEEYEKGNFHPPWLWSIIEVVKQTYRFGSVHIGSFKDEPPPIAIPHNCDKCSAKIEMLFEKYNKTHDLKLLENLDCECKKDWEKVIKA